VVTKNRLITLPSKSHCNNNKKKTMTTLETAQQLDDIDSLKAFRQNFSLPQNMIYLDGNSLGPMPRGVQARVAKTLDVEWSQDLITSWTKHHWIDLPKTIGDKLSRLVGGGVGNCVVADTVSVNLFKALTSALALRRNRKIILSDIGNFPSDLYVAHGLEQFLQQGYQIKTVAPEEVTSAITDDVAVVMLTEVDYRTSRRHDMKAITARAHDKGCLTIWDLSHSVGAVPVDLLSAQADFAIGCTYKYLNGGPGAPAFIWVHPDHQNTVTPALVGWWGHAHPFAFDLNWTPASGIARQQCGTQGILSLVALDAAMDIWQSVDMQALYTKSKSLCSFFMARVEECCAHYGLRRAGPGNMTERGSHVSFHCPEGYAVMQALIHHNVIGDFRAPDMIRFGFAPLYNTHVEAWTAAKVLADILANRLWDKPEFQTRKAVT
jgi:kynureninase